MMMISLKTIPASSFFSLAEKTRSIGSSSGSSSRITITRCKSSPDNDDDSSCRNEKENEGDRRKQDVLARIAMLQTQKVRLTNYLDERSAYLTRFAEEANAEFDQVAQDARKQLDQASARIMDNIETQMQAFEESAESSKQEMEENQNKINDFELQFQKDRNEGLFFKNLGTSTSNDSKPIDKTIIPKIAQQMKQSASQSKTRRNIYLAFIALVTVSLLLSPSSSDWRKTLLLALILIGLLTQLAYEQTTFSHNDDNNNSSSNDDNNNDKD